MRAFKTLLGLLAITALACATELNYGHVTKQTTTASITNAVLVFYPDVGHIPLLQTIDVTGDNSDAVLICSSGVVPYIITTNVLTSATEIGVNTTNGLLVGDFAIIIRADGTGGTFHEITARHASSVTLKYQVGTAATLGDTLWQVGISTTNAVAAATVRLNGPALYAGQIHAPISVRVLSTSGTTEKINQATVFYDSKVD